MAEDFPTLDVTDSRRFPPHLDTSTPNVARVYDYLIGGKDNFAVDREVGDRFLAALPEGSRGALMGRRFLYRAVRHMVLDAGITRFLDLGSGLPSAQNTHEVAQSVAPGSRVVYVDNDPLVLAHGRAILDKNPDTAVITADMRHIEEVFEAEETRRLLDPGRPVGLLLISVVHHLDDADDPQGMVRAYLDRLAPGSMMALAHFYRPLPEEGPEAESAAANAARLEEILLSGVGSGRFRTRAEITALFEGTELDEYGVGYLPHWRPDGPPAPLLEDERLLLCGVARKP